MKNLNLKAKFIVLIAPLLVLVLGLSITAFGLSGNVKARMEEALYNELYISSSNLINADRDFYQAYVAAILVSQPGEDPAQQNADLDENYQQTVDRVVAAMEAIKDNTDLYSKSTLESVNKKLGTATEATQFSSMTMEQLNAGFVSKINDWYAADNDTDGKQFFSESRDYLNAMEDLLDAYASYELKSIDRSINGQLAAATVVVVIVLILAIILVVWMVNYILKGINATKENLDKLAAKNISFEPIRVDSNDEIGQMSEASAQLTMAMNQVISGIKDTAISLTEAVREVSALCEQNSNSSVQIDDAVQELARATEQMASSVESTNSQTIEMGTDIENIGDGVQRLLVSSNAIKNANDQATACMKKITNSSAQTVKSVNQISEQIGETNKAIAEINSVVTTIMEISSQTNLLALNASIEAARAGEAGRGFAVVADEIGKLASQSQDGAKQIEEVAQKMIQMSSDSVKLAGQVAGIIDEEQQEISDTTDRFDVLSTEVASSLGQIDEISGRTDALMSVKNVILENVTDLSSISEENGAMGEEISASVTQMSDAISNTMSKAEEMQALAEQLQGLVEDFN